LALALGCGGEAPVAVTPVRQQTPEEEILSIATTWEARYRDNGLRSEPSKISVFSQSGLSALELTQGQPIARETVLLEETFRTRDGRQFACRAEGVLQVQVRYFRKGDEPAVEVTRPETELDRHCDQPGFPEPTVGVGLPKSSFLLRGENLMGFDPPLEKRSYIPVQ
jgi:xanthine/CO dehydrogenase XdhC/CoxF family maturation factor